jgi:HK97 family phage prohead protease
MTDTFTTATPVLVRAFPSALTQTGQRQLTGRLVPFDQATDVGDPLPGGGLDIYREGFRRGAFTPQASSNEKGVLNRIGLVHRHEGGLGYLGPFVALREQDDGLWGDVSVLRSKADDVEDLLAAGVNELSVEFRLRRGDNTVVDGDGVRWRTNVHLDGVALEAKGAYSGAQVAAFRAEMDELVADKAKAQAELSAEEAHQKLIDDAAAAGVALARAEADATLERKRQFELLAGRFDRDLARQQEYVRDFGLMLPPHGGLPQRQY